MPVHLAVVLLVALTFLFFSVACQLMKKPPLNSAREFASDGVITLLVGAVYISISNISSLWNVRFFEKIFYLAGVCIVATSVVLMLIGLVISLVNLVFPKPLKN